MLIDNFINFINNKKPNFEPKSILDIGSRDLGQSLEFQTVYPNSKIIAIEANPEQFKICKDNSIGTSIEVYNFAASNENKITSFYLTHGNIGTSSILRPLDVPFATLKTYQEIQVESKNIGEWCNQLNLIPDVIWMDVQGFEYYVLLGLGDILKNVSFLHLESSEKPYYDGHILKDDIIKILDEYNFEYNFKNDVYHPYGEGDIFCVNKNIL
jgi:FkbM family methyltransferase